MMRLLLKIRVYYFVFAIAIVIATIPAYAAEIQTKAKYAYLLDYNTGTVLFEKNSEESMIPSSMTKLMTVYLTFNAIKKGDVTLDTKFPVSETAWRKGGSKMFVKEGDDVSIDDLLHGIIVQSGNDACIVIAEGIAGSEEAFAEDMNYMAEKIGLKNSHFKNSTGWPDDEHYMTARDLVILSKSIINDFPEYYPYFAKKEFTYNDIKQDNRNSLLYRSIGVDGLKTGHTEKAGYGIVVSAEQDGRRLILAINGLQSNKDRITEAERLLRHGFRDFKNILLFKKGDVVENAEIWMGEDSALPLVTSEDVYLTRNKRISKNDDIELSVTYNSPWPAPVKKGEHIANLSIKRNGEITTEVPLFAGKDIEKLSFIGRMIAIPTYYLFGR